MKITTIVPAYNEEKLIGQTLSSIAESSGAWGRRGWEREGVVCDNNSTDRTAEVAKSHGARVVFEPVNQIARARNRGASVASGDWLVFVDADSRPSFELFDEAAECMAGGQVLGGGANVCLDEETWRTRALVEGWNLLSRAMRWMAGSFVFCERAAFWAIGGFNEELFVSEEIDFSQRLKRLARRQGKRIVILRRHPLLTSARKMHLYSPLEYLAFLFKTVCRGGGTLRDRSACAPWYDGRR